MGCKWQGQTIYYKGGRSMYKCKTAIFSACESCKHAETEPGKEPCRGCLKERKCPYFTLPADCSGCRWEAKHV